MLGYVGEITDDELDQFAEQGYHGGDWIGKSGLERLYDPSLHGQDGGFLIEVDARGRQVRVIRHVLPQAGKDLVLTLDEKSRSWRKRSFDDTGSSRVGGGHESSNGRTHRAGLFPGIRPQSLHAARRFRGTEGSPFGSRIFLSTTGRSRRSIRLGRPSKS